MDVNPTGYRVFMEDIKARGQQEPITIYEGKILDGRNRYDACVELHLGIKTKLYEGDDPIGFVLSANLQRRHLNESQRAIVGAKLSNLELGANQHSGKEGTPIGVAAKLLNVGRGSIDRAKVILKAGDPSLIDAVEKGTVSVNAAHQQAKQGSSGNAAAGTSGAGKGSGKAKGKGGGKGKGGIGKGKTNDSISASEAYDKAQEDLIEKLKALAPDAAEAAAQETIDKLNEIVDIMLRAAQSMKDEDEDEEKEAA
jgi:hypothetical protein